MFVTTDTPGIMGNWYIIGKQHRRYAFSASTSSTGYRRGINELNKNGINSLIISYVSNSLTAMPYNIKSFYIVYLAALWFIDNLMASLA